jgi:hypothetical protein
MLKKQLTLGIYLCLLLSLPLSAEINYNLSDFESGQSGSFGLVQVDGNSFIKTGLSPDFMVGPVDLGLDINFYLPLDGGGEYPSDLEFLTIRRLGYKTENYGFSWGHLSNLTIGQGLLMDNYDSGIGGTDLFTTSKAGLHAYGKIKGLGLEGLYTGTNVKGARVTIPLLSETLVLGSPLILGATYITDTDGIDEDVDSTTITRDSQAGYAVDLSLPIAGDLFTVYTEVATLEDHGSGGSVGFRGNVWNQVNYRFEYRVLEEDFVPGYFSRTYEATSFNFEEDAPADRISGFLGAVSTSFMKEYMKAGLMYENYDDVNLLTAGVGWKKLGNTVGVINYTVPFQGESSKVVEADLIYYTGSYLDYEISIKRTYITSDTFTESYQVGARMNLDRFASFLK